MNNMAIVENKYTDQTWLTIRNDRQIVIDRLRGMIVNGKNLTNQEIIALADYSLANDLNPFAGECYMIPNVGPTAGIAGYRRKAMEQLYKEVAMTGEKFNGENYSIDYEPAENSEANFVPGKDFAWKATLTDTLSKRQWLKQVFNAAGELKKVFPDVDFGEIIKQAEKLVGACPSWWAVGVVKGEESFGRDMFDRNERAKKRAAKLVLKARFPGVRFPEETIDIDEPERVEIIETGNVHQNQLEGKSDDDLVRELGFEVPPAQVKQSPAPAINLDIDPDNPPMTYETACAVADRHGNLYDSVDTAKLSYVANSLQKSLDNNGLTQAEHEQKQFKLDAIKVILAHRNSASTATPTAD